MVLVPRVSPEHLLVRDSPGESKKTVARVFERTRIGGARVHPGGKLVDPNGAKVNGVTNEVKPGDHGGGYLDNRPIVDKAIVAVAETDGGRQGYVANNTIPFARPMPGDVGEQLLEGCDRLLRFIYLGLDRLPLRVSIVLVLHLVSNRQTPVKLLDDGLLGIDRGLDILATSLEGSLAHQQDLPLWLTAAFAELAELVLFLVGVEENVPRREEVEDAGFGSVGEEKATSALNIGGLGVTDGNTKSGGEGLAEDGGGVGADGGFVHHRRAGELRFTDYDVNVVDIVLEKDRSAMDGDLDAKFGRESAMVDPDQDDGGRGRLASYADSEGVQTRVLHLLIEQVTIHGRTHSALPDLIETVRAEGNQLLWVEVRLSARRLHPDVGVGASDKEGLRGKAIEVIIRLGLGRNVGSIGLSSS